MAGDWIKWTKGLASKREIVLVASRLKRDRDEIAGKLMRLWEWCDDNFSENDVDSVSLDVSLKLGDTAFGFVDALCGLPGLAEALASPDVRWIEARSGGRVVFPNLARHNGTSAKERLLERDKKRKQRASKEKLSLNSGDKIGTREEKRREESSNEDSKARAGPTIEAFEIWWRIYPRHVKKPKAFEAWKKTIAIIRQRNDWPADGTAESWLNQATKEFSQSVEGRGDFCPHPTTWLNAGRFDDDRKEWHRDSGTSVSKNNTRQHSANPGISRGNEEEWAERFQAAEAG